MGSDRHIAVQGQHKVSRVDIHAAKLHPESRQGQIAMSIQAQAITAFPVILHQISACLIEHSTAASDERKQRG